MKHIHVLITLTIATFMESDAFQGAFTSTATNNQKLKCWKHLNECKISSATTTALFFQEPKKDEGQSHRETSFSSLKALDLNNNKSSAEEKEPRDPLHSLRSFFMSITRTSNGGPPPMKIEDTSLLFYDIFLILNLSVSISFWVVHRMSFLSIVPAFSEGSLLCILWIISGLWNGAFLYSAADGHYDMTREENANAGKGGPTSAALLGLSTFIGTANLRILVALGMAVMEHRRVGVTDGEELIPLEIAFGLMLMSAWRLLHSSYTRL